VYGAEAYLQGRATKELASLDWIGLEADSSMEFEQWRRKNIPTERVRLRASSSWAMRDAVDAGVGVGVFPCALGGARPGWRRVRRLPGTTPLWILTHEDPRTTARVRVLRDFLSE
jgi:DNA-binding transcriptional LysR family regulator